MIDHENGMRLTGIGDVADGTGGYNHNAGFGLNQLLPKQVDEIMLGCEAIRSKPLNLYQDNLQI